MTNSDPSQQRLSTKEFLQPKVYSDFTNKIPATEVGRKDTKQSNVVFSKMQPCTIGIVSYTTCAGQGSVHHILVCLGMGS